MKAPLKLIAVAPDLPSMFAHLREREARMRDEGLSTEGESAGAKWAIGAMEEMLGVTPECRFSDDIHELMIGSVRGG